jgi:hypothetical protein
VLYGEGVGSRVRAAAGGLVDAVFDVAGKTPVEELVSLVSEPSQVVSIANFAAGQAGARVTGGGADSRPVEALAEVAELLAENKLVIEVQTFPFDRAAEAYRISQDGHVRGKLALIPDGPGRGQSRDRLIPAATAPARTCSGRATRVSLTTAGLSECAEGAHPRFLTAVRADAPSLRDPLRGPLRLAGSPAAEFSPREGRRSPSWPGGTTPFPRWDSSSAPSSPSGQVRARCRHPRPSPADVRLAP